MRLILVDKVHFWTLHVLPTFPTFARSQIASVRIISAIIEWPFPRFLGHSGNLEFLARQRASPCSDYTDGSSSSDEKEIDVDDEMNLRRAVPHGTCKVHTMPPFFSFLLFFLHRLFVH